MTWSRRAEQCYPTPFLLQSWQKKKKEKERQVKKRKGTAATHVAVAIKGVSGKRTKKSQRKAVHVGRLAGKQQAALESEMQVRP